MKCINGIVDILGINNIVFNSSKNFDSSQRKQYHLEVGYYELKDKIGSNDIENNMDYYCAKNNEELLQLALKIAGGTNILDVEKLINADIITNARIQAKYDGYKDIKHTLIIEGFSPGKALKFINENSLKNDIQIISVYQVTEGFLSNTRIKIADISDDINFKNHIVTAIERKSIKAKENLNKSFEMVKSLEPELNQNKMDFPLKELKKMFNTTKDIEIELKKYIDAQLTQNSISENPNKISEEEEEDER